MATRSKLVLIFGVPLVVLALGVSSAAIAAGDATPPTTSDDYDGLWHSSDVTVNLTPVEAITAPDRGVVKSTGTSFVPH